MKSLPLSIKVDVLERDNWNCQWCKIDLRERDNMNVHHLDGNRENNKMENLISVCTTCHQNYHQNLFKQLKKEEPKDD